MTNLHHNYVRYRRAGRGHLLAIGAVEVPGRATAGIR